MDMPCALEDNFYMIQGIKAPLRELKCMHMLSHLCTSTLKSTNMFMLKPRWHCWRYWLGLSDGRELGSYRIGV